MQKKPKEYNYYQISQVRNVLFGIATLLIVAFHSVHLEGASAFAAVNKIADFFLYYGNIGVDIFLFLSGMGLYYSFSENQDVKTFYLRRGIRLLPALLVVNTAHSALLFFTKKITFWHFLSNTFLLSFFIDGEDGSWFFSLLVLLYAVYPLLHKVLHAHRFAGLAAVLAIITALCVALYIFFPQRFEMYEKALLRVYVFVAGAWMGKRIKSKVACPLRTAAIACVATVALTVFILGYFHTFLDHHIYLIRLLYCPLTIALVTLFSMLIPTSKNPVNTVLIWIGSLSCEVYLLFERADYFLYKKVSAYFPKPDFSFLYYIGLFLLVLGCAWVLSKACGVVQKKLSEKLKVR